MHPAGVTAILPGRYKFMGGWLDAWGVMLINAVLVLVTCGVALVFGVPASRMQYWAITNTARDGACFRYEAGFGEAIGAALVRTLLLIVTCGFALPWTTAMSQRFRVEHTSTAEGHRMRFTGTGGEVLGLWLLALVTLPLSFGLAWPWLAVLRERWVASSTVVLDPSAPGGEYRLRFDAGALSYFVQGVLSLLLSIVTLGLYGPWAIAGYHAFVWSSMSDTLSPPVAVPSGPRGPAQWAVVAAAGTGVTLLVGACLFLAVLPAALGAIGSGAAEGGSRVRDESRRAAIGEDGSRRVREDSGRAPSAEARPTRRSTAEAGRGDRPRAGVTAPEDVDSYALAWWRHDDAGARDRLAAQGLSLALIRATASLNVRGGPGASERYVRTLPEGTVMVALRGTVGGTLSQPGRGNWSWIVASETLSGWVASGVTTDHRDCTPEPDALPVPGGPDRAAAVWRDVLVSRIDGTDSRAMFLLTARDPDAGASYAALFDADRTCRLDQKHFVQLEGELEDALVTWTAQHGGEPLLGAGVRPFDTPGAATTWRIWSIGASEPTWQVTLSTAMDVPDPERGGIVAPYVARRGPSPGWWPLRVRRPGQDSEYYVWTGSTLALQ